LSGAARDRHSAHSAVFFGSRRIASIDLTNGQPVSDVSEQVSANVPGLNIKPGNDRCCRGSNGYER